MNYGTAVTITAPFSDTVARVRTELQAEGFGVLTEIDVTATLRDKLGEQIEDYLILGACNPPLAHRALGADRSIGLLLPCNVVVRSAGNDTVVELLDPAVMSSLSAGNGMAEIAADAADRLGRVARRLADETPDAAAVAGES